MGDFPSQVNSIQAPGIAGDFASANPRKTILAGEGALVAGTGVINGVAVPGAVVGRFCWLSYQSVDNDNAPGTLNTFGVGLPAGLVSRKQVGMITQSLATAVQYLLSGFQILGWNDVDMWVTNAGTTEALVGQKAFAVFADGSATFAAAGATPTGGSGTASSIAAGAAANITAGTIVGDVFNALGTLTGNFYAGAVLSGTGVATNTSIVSQILPLLAGEALNGIGRYTVSIPEQSVAATTITATYGVLTVGGTVTGGAFGPGQAITGSGVTTTPPTVIGQQLTGTPGGAGTYTVNNATVVGSTTLLSQSSIETKWIARSAGAVGEVIKISPTT